MKKLMKMTEYVWRQWQLWDENKITDLQYIQRTRVCQQLLSTPPVLEYFIPCDKEGKPMEKPELVVRGTQGVTYKKFYQEALDRVMFEGIRIEEGAGYCVLMQRSKCIAQKYNDQIEWNWKFETIEDLQATGIELTLTDNYANKLKL